MSWIELVSKAAIDAKNIKKDGAVGVINTRTYSNEYLRLMEIMLKTLDIPTNVVAIDNETIYQIEFNAAADKHFYCLKEVNKGIRCNSQCKACITNYK